LEDQLGPFHKPLEAPVQVWARAGKTAQKINNDPSKARKNRLPAQYE
jgi:hypothetical protein